MTRLFRSAAWTALLVPSMLAAGCSAKQGLESIGFDLGGDEPEVFSLAVAAGDAKRAYDLLCPAYRFGIPFERFRSAVEANPFLSTATGVSIDGYRSGGGLALVKEGWIESSSGVAEAQFYLSKVGAWCLTGVVIGGTPALPVPSADAGAGEGDVRAPLPASLQNEAYRAFGLGRTKSRRYTMSRDGGEPEAGTQRVEPLDVEGDRARFRIVRSGALGEIGSLEVALESSGIWVERSSQGQLVERALLMPARLEPGTSWRTAYRLDTPGGGETRYDGEDTVVGKTRVTTAAGTFDAIEVRSTATVENGNQRGTVETRVWYAEGLGSVRVESTTTLAGESPTRLVLELLEPPS